MPRHVLYLIPCNQRLQHPKNYKNKKQDGRRHRIQLFKAQKTKKIELISKVSRKRKGIQQKKLSDTQCESTVEELRVSENIATKLGMGWV